MDFSIDEMIPWVQSPKSSAPMVWFVPWEWIAIHYERFRAHMQYNDILFDLAIGIRYHRGPNGLEWQFAITSREGYDCRDLILPWDPDTATSYWIEGVLSKRINPVDFIILGIPS